MAIKKLRLDCKILLSTSTYSFCRSYFFHPMATGYNENISYPTFSIASNVGIQIFVQFQKIVFDSFSKVQNDMNYYGI